MPASPHLVPTAPHVTVSMDNEYPVISSDDQLDVEATEALISLVATTVRAGLTVMIDLDPTTPSDDLVAHGPANEPLRSILRRPGSGVCVLGPGRVRLDMVEAMWTIDIGRSRLFRSDKPIDPYFVDSDDWTPIRALWVDCETVTALTVDGTYLCCDAAWAIRPREDRLAG